MQAHDKLDKLTLERDALQEALTQIAQEIEQKVD